MPNTLEAEFAARLDGLLQRLAGGDMSSDSWREVAEALAEAVRQAPPAPEWIGPIHQLAADEDPVVRRNIARALPDLPDGMFAELSASLANDCNSYVRTAVARAVEQRGKGQRRSRKMRKEVAAFRERFQVFEKTFGARAARQARRMANELFDAMVGGTLHDMEGILLPMRADLSLMRKHFEDGQPGRGSCRVKVNKFSRQVEYLQAFLNDMRTYARTEESKRTRVDVGDLVRDALALARDGLHTAGLDMAGVAVAVDAPEALRVPLYRHRATTALMNLIRNGLETLVEAVVAGEKKLAVRARSDGAGGVILAVEDNGPGIDPKTLQELLAFAPGKTTRKSRGTGFGLPTAHRFAEMHGGRLDIESRPGAGAVFTLALPASEEPDE